MRQQFFRIILLFSLIFIAVLLVYALQNNRQLKLEKQKLILKNDSLHIKQLETKQKLALLSRKIDSLTHKSYLKNKN